MQALKTERHIAESRASLIQQSSVAIPLETLDNARNIALTLLRTFADRPSYVLGITSVLPSEGKTTLGVALAEVMSTDFGLSVLLVDGHAERHWLATENEHEPGLSDWLTDTTTLDETLSLVHDKCSVLPFGTQTITSRDVLQSLTRQNDFAQLRARFSLIVLDLPDLMNPAAAALANLCDGLVMVVRSGETPVDRVKEFLPLLENVTIHGAVLNRHRSSVPESILRMFA